MKVRKSSRLRHRAVQVVCEQLEDRQHTSVTPIAPIGTYASNVSSSQVTLNFRNYSGNESGIAADQWMGSSWACVKFVSPGNQSITVTGLQPGTTYYFDVGAVSTNYQYASWDNYIQVNTPAIATSTSPISARAQYNASRIDSLGVTYNQRYQPDANGNTKCNVFASDAVGAAGGYLPLVVGNQWYTANQQYNWLANPANGWRDLGFGMSGGNTAQTYANSGWVVVATWYNSSGGSGHIAIVRPYAGQYDWNRGPHITQAGASNFTDGTVSQGFYSSQFSQIRYFAEYVGS